MSAEIGRTLLNSLTGEHVHADVPCPNDGEMVNVRCWWCGWLRDPAQREKDLRAELAAHPWGRHHLFSRLSGGQG